MQTIESLETKLRLLDCKIINSNDFGIGYSDKGKNSRDSMNLLLLCKGKAIARPEFIDLSGLYIYDDFIVIVDRNLKIYAFVKDIEENIIDRMELKGYTTSLKMTDPVESIDGRTVVMGILVRGNILLLNKEGEIVNLEEVTKVQSNVRLPNHMYSYCDSLTCDTKGNCVMVIKYRDKPNISYQYVFDKDLNLINHKYKRY